MENHLSRTKSKYNRFWVDFRVCVHLFLSLAFIIGVRILFTSIHMNKHTYIYLFIHSGFPLNIHSDDGCLRGAMNASSEKSRMFAEDFMQLPFPVIHRCSQTVRPSLPLFIYRNSLLFALSRTQTRTQIHEYPVSLAHKYADISSTNVYVCASSFPLHVIWFTSQFVT